MTGRQIIEYYLGNTSLAQKMRAEYGSYLQDMNRADAAYLAGELATQIRDSLDSTPSSFALALAEEMKADFSEVDDAVAALKPIVDALFKSWY